MAGRRSRHTLRDDVPGPPRTSKTSKLHQLHSLTFANILESLALNIILVYKFINHYLRTGLSHVAKTYRNGHVQETFSTQRYWAHSAWDIRHRDRRGTAPAIGRAHV